jgi:hypothetical protein
MIFYSALAQAKLYLNQSFANPATLLLKDYLPGIVADSL